MASTTIQVTLLVKGDPDRAAQEVVARLNPWFLEDPRDAPYPEGSLLHWRQTTIATHNP